MVPFEELQGKAGGYELRDSWCYPSVFSRSDCGMVSQWLIRQWVFLGCLGCGGERRWAIAGQGCTGADIPNTLWLKVIGIHSLIPRGQNSKPKCLQGYIPAEGLWEESSVDFSASDSKFMFQTRLLCQLKKKKEKKTQPKSSWELCFNTDLSRRDSLSDNSDRLFWEGG